MQYLTEHNILTVFICICLILSALCAYLGYKWNKEDNQKPISNPLNDAYLYGVWGIEQPHYNND